jgi:CheY-like chemotaxis protein
MPTATKVLAAAAPDMDGQIRDCLPGHDLTFVRTMSEAMRSLRHDGFQLVVIDLDFDESRMLELLQYIRTLPHYKEVPVVCVHGGDQVRLSAAVMRNIDVAVKALGGMAFLNLQDGAPEHTKECGFLDRVGIESGTSARPS